MKFHVCGRIVLGSWLTFSSTSPTAATKASRPGESLHKTLQGLRIDSRRLMSKLLHVLNIRARINSGMAVRAALAAQFQYT